MSIPDFSDIELGSGAAPSGDRQEWTEALRAATGKDVDALTWETPEGIGVKPLYTAEEFVAFPHYGLGVTFILAVNRVAHGKVLVRLAACIVFIHAKRILLGS